MLLAAGSDIRCSITREITGLIGIFGNPRNVVECTATH
jgi:hypothetical protein